MERTHGNSVRTRKPPGIRGVIFGVGTTLSLAFSSLIVWVGSQENLHGKFFNPETGRWEWGYVAVLYLMPLVPWLGLFALFGGFRRRVQG